MTEQYAVVSYDTRRDDDNEIEMIHVTDNLEYAEKLAFHHVKKELPSKDYSYFKKCRILKNYYHESSIYLHHVIVEYRICEVTYNDTCEEYEKYDITDVWNNVWAVVKINNHVQELEEIDETLIHKH